MALVRRSFTVLDAPPKVWAIVSNLLRWDRLLFIDDARKKFWGNRFQVKAGSGEGMELILFNGEDPVQEWVVEKWEANQRLRIASRQTYGDPPTSTDASFDVTITPVSETETKVEIEFSLTFNNPLYSLILSLLPMKGQQTKILRRFENGLVGALDGK